MIDKNILLRTAYSQKVKPFIGKQLVKVFTGQRRIGKSCVLKQIVAMIQAEVKKANVIFIDKERLEFSDITDCKSLNEYVIKHLKGKNNFLFIDEVQEIDEFELCLRSLLNENKCDIYVTGSNANLLSGELATTLSGRYVEIPVHSLSFNEFLEFNGLDVSSEALLKYLTLGGMPYLKNLNLDQEFCLEYLKNVYSTILLKDVVARANIRNVRLLENLVAFLVSNTGAILSAGNISRYLKSQKINVPVQTVLNYLWALCNAFFIYKTERIDVEGLKIFEVGEKYYFEDVGLRNAIREINFRSDAGKLVENAVFMHLKRLGYTVYVGTALNKEIDFIAVRGKERIYIQAAYLLLDDDTVQREFSPLMNLANHYPKIVVSMDAIPVEGDFKGVEHVYLGDFLRNDNL